MNQHIEVDLKDIEIPRLTELQKQILHASNNNPEETIVTLDNAAVVAILKKDGAFSLRKHWDAHVMSGVSAYRDFQIPATKDMDADMYALAYEMARQRLTPADIATALQAVDDDQIERFDVGPQEAELGRPVQYVRVDTDHGEPFKPQA